MYIDCESVYSSSSAEKQTSETLLTLRKKIIRYLCIISVDFIHSCHHCLKMSSFSLKKNRFRSIDLTCYISDQPTAFTILNSLEYEFLKGFLVQGRQQAFWNFSVLSYILDLQWCRPKKWKIHSQLSAMFTCRDGNGGKGGELSSQASKQLYKPPGAVYVAGFHCHATKK